MIMTDKELNDGLSELFQKFYEVYIMGQNSADFVTNDFKRAGLGEDLDVVLAFYMTVRLVKEHFLSFETVKLALIELGCINPFNEMALVYGANEAGHVFK